MGKTSTILSPLEDSLSALLCYRNPEGDRAQVLKELAEELARARFPCKNLRAKVLDCVGTEWDIGIGLMRIYDIVCRGKGDSYEPNGNERKAFFDPRYPLGNHPPGKSARFHMRKLVGNLFRHVVAHPAGQSEGRFNLAGEVRKSLGLLDFVPIDRSSSIVQKAKDQVLAEYRAKHIENCRLNAKIFIEKLKYLKEEREAKWFTPAILLEHYSSGVFGAMFVGKSGFIEDNPQFYIEVNDRFLSALPFHWQPPILNRFPERRSGNLKSGYSRYHVLEFLGAAVATYYCLGADSPYAQLYSHLDVMFIALRREGHNILIPNGPNEFGGLHSQNFVAALESIQNAAGKIDSAALIRPWYWRRISKTRADRYYGEYSIK